VAFLLLLCTAGGCSLQPGPIFDRQYPDLVWPPRPAESRIRYVGQISTADDLKAPPNVLEAMGALLAGKEKPARLYGPRSVIVTHAGRRVWVADPGGRRVHLLDLEERRHLEITRAGDAPLLTPVDLCTGPDDSIYVCDSEAVGIHRFSAVTGVFIGSMRLPEDVQRPVGLHYDVDQQELFVVDVAEHNIKVLAPDGRVLRIIGRRGERQGEFNFPCDIAGDGDTIWVVDAGNNRVQGLTREGAPVQTIGSVGDSPGDLALPKSIALDSEGHLYVVDARFENVQIFDRSGRLLLFFGEEGAGPGEFWLPAGIFIEPGDRIWICDSYNGRLQVFEFVKGIHDQEAGPLDNDQSPDTASPSSTPGQPEEVTP